MEKHRECMLRLNYWMVIGDGKSSLLRLILSLLIFTVTTSHMEASEAWKKGKDVLICRLLEPRSSSTIPITIVITQHDQFHISCEFRGIFLHDLTIATLSSNSQVTQPKCRRVVGLRARITRTLSDTLSLIIWGWRASQTSARLKITKIVRHLNGNLSKYRRSSRYYLLWSCTFASPLHHSQLITQL